MRVDALSAYGTKANLRPAHCLLPQGKQAPFTSKEVYMSEHSPQTLVQGQTVLLYDGACHLCSREIQLYKKHNVDKVIGFGDISAKGFDAQAWGVDAQAVHKHMHVRLADGSYRTGLDAFIAVWQVLPGYGWMARVAQTPGVSQALRLGYKVFAKIRPWLPKRRNAGASCEVSF
jgi:predicted DCC family thiol-disulfide oxidoreductase YuxK